MDCQIFSSLLFYQNIFYFYDVYLDYLAITKKKMVFSVNFVFSMSVLKDDTSIPSDTKSHTLTSLGN